MRVLIQRVKRASVTIEPENLAEKREISEGLVLLVGVHSEDTPEKAVFLAQKTANLRIFSDSEGKMNRSLLDLGGQALCVSNFTLYADCSHGRRPAFTPAARPPLAEELYELYVKELGASGVTEVRTGSFGADMLVEIQNDGPVTILLDSDEIMK